MASQSVLELAVNTGKWDSGLKKAKQALDNFTTASGGIQQALDKDADKMQKFVQMMGSMESKAKTAKGQMNDYKGTIEQLTMQYNRMTEAQQKTIGQDYLNSIEQLKKKYNEVSQEQQEMNRSLQNTSGTVEDSGGVLDKLTKRFTVNIDAIKLFNIGLQAAEGALNVVKDAFFSNEENLDDWGRTVETSRSLYKGFLYALNNGDISGYLSNIDQIVQAAKNAYDALDELGTFNAFNQINVQRTHTNMTESIVDYRSGEGSKDAVKAAGEAYKKELEERKRLEKDAYLAAVARVAAERGVSAKDLTDALSGTYGHYQDLKKVNPTGERTVFYGGGMFGGGGSYIEKFAQNPQERLGQALRQLTDTELQSLQALGAQAERTGDEIAQVDKQLTRVLNGRQPGESGGGGKGGKVKKIKAEEILPVGSVAALTKEMQELRKEQSKVTSTSAWVEYQRRIFGVTDAMKMLRGELSPQGLGAVSISDMGRKSVEAAKQSLKEKKLDVKIVQPKEKADAQASEILGSISSAVGNMASGIEGLGIKIPEDMKNMLGALNSITMILTSIEAFQKIGALLGIFSHGGVVKAASGYTVPGRNFSGDMIPARLNAGELVLNQAQAGVIASALQDRDFSGGMGGQPYTNGENIILGINNTYKRKGMGEIVTTSMLRRMGLMN